MEAEPEPQLIARAQTDPQAFGLLYDRYYTRISAYTLHRTGDVEVALDLTAITFVKAWQYVRDGKFVWQDVPFSSLLYRIAGNEIATHYRRQRHRVLSLEVLFETKGIELVSDCDLEAEAVEWQRQLAIHQDFELVLRLLKGLPPKYQEILALRFFEKKPLTEIAAITGKKLNTVKSLLKRGTEKLRAAHAAQASTDTIIATFAPAKRYNSWRKQP